MVARSSLIVGNEFCRHQQNQGPDSRPILPLIQEVGARAPLSLPAGQDLATRCSEQAASAPSHPVCVARIASRPPLSRSSSPKTNSTEPLASSISSLLPGCGCATTVAGEPSDNVVIPTPATPVSCRVPSPVPRPRRICSSSTPLCLKFLPPEQPVSRSRSCLASQLAIAGNGSLRPGSVLIRPPPTVPAAKRRRRPFLIRAESRAPILPEGNEQDDERVDQPVFCFPIECLG
ncbi:uncharacterized protein LOC119331714 [Triticum dicoccoides]|uniref:uncharacterized protein LOC119331714 n=1 Tax=Triticum dicoccoides TaxID=85692 RepID=UPI00189123D7|nr:uncharacterized protein LOC119331714 [Triticum dicoccoides]